MKQDPEREWEIWFTRQAQKDFGRLSSAGLENKAREILQLLKANSFQNPPPCEKLVGDLAGAHYE